MTASAIMRLVGLLVIVGVVAGCRAAPPSGSPTDPHAEAQAKYGALMGTVYDSDGTPLDGVEVTAFPAGSSVDDETDPVHMSVSTAEVSPPEPPGKYGMALDPGVYDVYARRGDVPMSRLMVATSVKITLVRKTVVNISLPPLPE